MHKKIKVIPLAEESFGVRSMCTYVETSDTRILLDAGVSLAPKRMGYPPHPREYQALAECRKKIAETAEKVDIITISHYHFDHHTPSYTDWFTNWSSAETAKQIYAGKIVLAKSYRSMVNAGQRLRGWMFKKTSGDCAKKFEIADSRVFKFGDTTLRFSNPVLHGTENPALGWVLMLSIEYADEKLVFTSDVQGPMHTSTLNKILAEKPQLVIVGGPPTYLAGFKVKEEYIEQGIQNLKRIVETIPTTVLGHHIFRDKRWRSQFQPVFDASSETCHEVLTASEFLGIENNFLEFRRSELFEIEPPTTEFNQWLKMPLQKRKLEKPPI